MSFNGIPSWKQAKHFIFRISQQDSGLIKGKNCTFLGTKILGLNSDDICGVPYYDG